LTEDKTLPIEVSNANNKTETEFNSSDSESVLPSVKDLVNRFSVNCAQNDETQKPNDIKRQNSFSNEKISNLPKKASPRMTQLSQPNFKVWQMSEIDPGLK
jgi:hypothetical protein